MRQWKEQEAITQVPRQWKDIATTDFTPKGGFEKLVVMPLVIFGTFSNYSTTTKLPPIICVPSSLDHKLLTAGNVSESHVFPEPSSVHCTWLMLSKAFRKKM